MEKSQVTVVLRSWPGSLEWRRCLQPSSPCSSRKRRQDRDSSGYTSLKYSPRRLTKPYSSIPKTTVFRQESEFTRLYSVIIRALVDREKEDRDLDRNHFPFSKFDTRLIVDNAIENSTFHICSLDIF